MKKFLYFNFLAIILTYVSLLYQKNILVDRIVALLHKDLKCKAPLIDPNLRRNLGKWAT